MLNIKCYAQRNDKAVPYPARLIGFAPTKYSENQFEIAGEEEQYKAEVRAIVVLETFSRGTILHLPLRLIKVVPQFYEEDDKYNADNDDSVMGGRYVDN